MMKLVDEGREKSMSFLRPAPTDILPYFSNIIANCHYLSSMITAVRLKNLY